jgi:hypothetical protein
MSRRVVGVWVVTSHGQWSMSWIDGWAAELLSPRRIGTDVTRDT